MKRKIGRMLTSLCLCCCITSTVVCAEPSLEEQKSSKESEVSQLQTQLNELFASISEVENKLIAKGQEISAAEEDLKAAEEVKEKQYEEMKLRIRYMYEEGDGTAMQRTLEAGTFSEALNQAEYMQKVHDYDREMLEEYQKTVNEVENLKTSLETEQSQLAELEEEYQTQSAQLSSTIESKQSEIASLDAMIQEAAKKAEEERLAQEAAAQAAALAGSGTASAGGATDSTSGTSGTSSSTYVEPTYNAVTGNAIVDRAYQWVGNAEYVWGGCSPGAFDCSGFVSYCLTGSYTRLGTTYTFLTWNRVSDPQPGDVCVNWGHCGIYIGNGQMIHAATEGVGVIVGSVQSGMVYVRY